MSSSRTTSQQTSPRVSTIWGTQGRNDHSELTCQMSRQLGLPSLLPRESVSIEKCSKRKDVGCKREQLVANDLDPEDRIVTFML
jgi:hypothetical protein